MSTLFHAYWRARAQEDTDTLRSEVYTRDDLVRAILGQQWAVAIALHYGFFSQGTHLDEFPCAVDVVEEMERT